MFNSLTSLKLKESGTELPKCVDTCFKIIII